MNQLEIKPRLIEIIRESIDQAVDCCMVTINGEAKKFSVIKTILKNNELRKYVYVAEDTGLITKAVLIDRFKNELAVQNTSVQKGSDGFTIAFDFVIHVEVTT